MKSFRLFLFSLFFLFSLSLSFTMVSALPIEDSLHLSVQVTNGTGTPIAGPGSFNVVFNLSQNADCTAPVFSQSNTVNTNDVGRFSIYLNNLSNLSFMEQFYLSYSRDSVFQNCTRVARSAFSFTTKNISWEGIIGRPNQDLNTTDDVSFASITQTGTGGNVCLSNGTNCVAGGGDFSFTDFQSSFLSNLSVGNQTILDITNITNFNFNYNQTQAVFDWSQFNTSVNQLVIANETPRFSNLVDGDCSGTDKMLGVQNNGTVFCSAVAGGGVTSWSFTTNEIFNITSTTNIGLGLANPTSKLHINLSSSVSPLNITFDDITPVMFIDSSGNVGIGTSSPAYTLDVNGALRIQGDNLTMENGCYFRNPGNNRVNFICPGQDAVFNIFESAGNRFIILKHDSTDGNISTSLGDLHLNPIGGDVLLGGANLELGGSINISTNGENLTIGGADMNYNGSTLQIRVT